MSKQDFSFSAFIEIDYEDDDIECNLPLLDGAQLSATSSLNERGPENARLNGESSNYFLANSRASCTELFSETISFSCVYDFYVHHRYS